ncbi:RHS repeat-associated core domain-containing protein [Aliikangiella maris]|uniref:RHS repeat-associated core domain-containing protein n=2 Tax=Aliikangiella maris TaxID=3162458 RepID=A0ABV2BUC9_9GAMM
MSVLIAMNASANIFTTEIQYNQYGEIADISYQSLGETQTYHYDYELAGAIRRVQRNNTDVYCVEQFNAANQPLISQYECDNTNLVSYQYDNWGRLKNSHLKHQNNTWYLSAIDGYDVNDFVIGMSKTAPQIDGEFIRTKSIQYYYNNQGQLTAYHYGTAIVNYQYDGQGNLISHNAIKGMSPLLKQNYTNGYHQDKFSYDEAGRLIKDDKYRYHYDYTGRLKMIRDVDSQQIVEAYRYDAQGKRVSLYQAAEQSVTFNQLGPSGEILKQEKHSFDATNSQQNQPEKVVHYTPMNGSSQHSITYTYDSQSNNYQVQTEWSFKDRLGNPVLNWKEDDTLPRHTEYSPYGQQLAENSENKHSGAYGFTGVHSDEATGLIYMQARYQNPLYGRFLTPDPAKDANPYRPHSYNLYHYTANNPINAWDPTGLNSNYCELSSCTGEDKPETIESANKILEDAEKLEYELLSTYHETVAMMAKEDVESGDIIRPVYSENSETGEITVANREDVLSTGSNTVWLKFDIKHDDIEQENLILQFYFPGKYRLYFTSKKNQLESLIFGRGVNEFYTRKSEYANQQLKVLELRSAVLLTPQMDLTRPIYIKLEHQGIQPIGHRLYPESQARQINTIENYFWGAIFGLIFLAIAVGCAAYLLTRLPSFIYFGLINLCALLICLLQLQIFPEIYQLFDSDLQLNRFCCLLICLLGYSSIKFIYYYVNFEKISQVSGYILVIARYFYLKLTIFIMLESMIFQSLSLTSYVLSAVVFLSGVSLLSGLIKGVWLKDRASMLTALAWIPGSRAAHLYQ